MILNSPAQTAEKGVFLQTTALCCRRMPFPTENYTFLQKKKKTPFPAERWGLQGAHGRKPQEIAEGFRHPPKGHPQNLLNFTWIARISLECYLTSTWILLEFYWSFTGILLEFYLIFHNLFELRAQDLRTLANFHKIIALCTGQVISQKFIRKEFLICLGVARGPLQERPLQFQHGNFCVKSWSTHVQLLVNFWPAGFCTHSW